VSVSAAVARHAAWYVRYQVDGSSRAQASAADARRRERR
jgi:hypothetical protein